jgi:hypothetical protein
MKKCGKTKDCSRDRYVCRSADDLNETASESSDIVNMGRIAEVLDTNKNGKFCVVREETAGPDAGSGGDGDDDAAAADGGKE